MVEFEHCDLEIQSEADIDDNRKQKNHNSFCLRIYLENSLILPHQKHVEYQRKERKNLEVTEGFRSNGRIKRADLYKPWDSQTSDYAIAN